MSSEQTVPMLTKQSGSIRSTRMSLNVNGGLLLLITLCLVVIIANVYTAHQPAGTGSVLLPSAIVHIAAFMLGLFLMAFCDQIRNRDI